jgi:hypothetical protein
VTSRAAPRDDAQACVRAYEALRSHVLAGANTASHAGLIVLLRQGVAAWMVRRSACTGPAPAAPRTTTLLVGEQIDNAIVRVLASMALAAQPEGHL